MGRHVCVSTRCEQKRPAPGEGSRPIRWWVERGGAHQLDSAERVALVARARRQTLLRAHRHRLRAQDLEDCLSQATLELVAQARAGATWASTAHVAHVLEQRFVSRVRDRRRAVSGRSPMQAALESALALGGLGEGFGCGVPDLAPGTEEQAMLRMELRRLPRLASGLSSDQRLVLASQISLQMGCAEFCALHGWTHEKYRKVAQRARARLRRLSEFDDGVPPVEWESDEKTGTHL
jgi:DNA-directed RNA polymerase specialized sigma24 family protein